MAELNIERILDNRTRIVNLRYDLRQSQVAYLLKRNRNQPFGLISDCFVLGYVQGHKAAIAEMKKKAVG